jgi:hypothetical protein
MHLEKEHLCIQCNCYFPLPMLLYRNYFCQCNVVYSVLRKILTYIEYRAVSGVFRSIDPFPPSECVLLPPHQRLGDTHSPGGEGVGGQYFGRRQTLDWPLTVLSLYAVLHLSKSHKYLNLRVHFLSSFSLPNFITGSTTNWNSIFVPRVR